MDVFTTYTAGWLTLQALPLLLSPKLIVTLLSVESRNPTGAVPPIFHLPRSEYANPDTRLDLETYLSRSLAIALLTLALLTLLLTGSVPLSSTPPPSSSSSSSFPDPQTPSALPTLLLTLFHTTCAIYVYTQYLNTGQTAFALGLVGYGFIAAMGLWCVLFGQGGHVSRRTGRDKRVSGWPFGEGRRRKGR
ncbi:hypothetical protein MMC30_000938 [Trapelia coarctata]|nr:hypothetical protein [Trapelia coarctata]